MKLPIHGFVLAGGLSSRMGQDKALLPFCGRPMAEIAVATLAAVCESVSIAGNREDLSEIAPIVRDARSGEGPTAGIEAGLQACSSEWALFLPVDLPLLPASFLHSWALSVLDRPATQVSYISCGGHPHPALCLLNRDCFHEVLETIAAGKRRVQSILQTLEGFWEADAAEFSIPPLSERWLTNINTPEELAFAEKL